MPKVPANIYSALKKPKVTNKVKTEEVTNHTDESIEAGDAEIQESIAKAWIIYHLSGALADRNCRLHNAKFALHNFKRVSQDLHHFVLVACKTCSDHHLDYINKNPMMEALQSDGGLEEWVFDLHNAVNARTGKAVLDKARHLQSVKTHYRIALENLGRRVNSTILSRALPILTMRHCYGCGS